jgi:hypothetical protein
MLSHIYLADAAMPARALSRTGASFAGGCTAVPRERAIETAGVRKAAAASVVAGLRPRASASTVTGNATHAAGLAKLALQQRISQKKDARTTRIAAVGGGAVGPHPAWDPV